MTAEVVNLRKARKARKRADDAATAAVNRAAFGRTRADKQAQAIEEMRVARKLDAHRLPGGDDGDAA